MNFKTFLRKAVLHSFCCENKTKHFWLLALLLIHFPDYTSSVRLLLTIIFYVSLPSQCSPLGPQGPLTPLRANAPAFCCLRFQRLIFPFFLCVYRHQHSAAYCAVSWGLSSFVFGCVRPFTALAYLCNCKVNKWDSIALTYLWHCKDTNLFSTLQNWKYLVNRRSFFLTISWSFYPGGPLPEGPLPLGIPEPPQFPPIARWSRACILPMEDQLNC